MNTMTLHPSLIERCPRSVRTPARAITAPEPDLRRAYTDEAVRQAQFDQSAATRNGVVAEFPSPAAASATLPEGAVAGFSDDEASK